MNTYVIKCHYDTQEYGNESKKDNLYLCSDYALDMKTHVRVCEFYAQSCNSM